jgi:hypothetical protein
MINLTLIKIYVVYVDRFVTLDNLIYFHFILSRNRRLIQSKKNYLYHNQVCEAFIEGKGKVSTLSQYE